LEGSSSNNPTELIPATVPAIVFDSLFQVLRSEGFAVGLQDYLEYTAIFQQYGGDRDRLKYYLAPVLCRNKEEQERFYAIYDRHTTGPESLSPNGRPVKDGRPSPNFYLPRPFRNFYFRALFLFLLIGGSKGIQLLRHRPHIIPAVHAVTQPDTLDNTADVPVAPRRTGPVFVAKELPPSTDSGGEKSRVIALGSPVEKENSVHSTAFAWLVVLGLGCLGLSISFFPQKKSNFLPEVDLATLRGDEVPLDIPFPTQDDLIQKLPALASLSRDLRQPIPTEIYRIDIQKTIRESVRHYGLLEPVYQNIERKPEYLLLIGKGNELLSQLFRWLSQALANEGVQINTYFYPEGAEIPLDGAEYYSDGAADPINMYTLRERHSGARLIVMNDGYSNPLPEGLEYWNTDEEWSDKFRALSEARAFPNGYYPPENMDLLREYLGSEDLFQWVCALAIYPSIQWEVLIAVGNAVLADRNAGRLLNYTSLRRIVRLPWLSGATIPLVVRTALLKKMDLAAEIAARKALLALLKESDELIADSPLADEERLLQIYTQSFVLYAHDVRRNRQYEEEAKKFMSLWNKKKIPDLATVIYLRNQDREWQTPLRSVDDPQKPVDANRFLNELVARRVISDPRIRAFFRNAALVCGLLLLLLILFKDNIAGLGINKTLGVIETDYHTNDITIAVPLTDCLKKRAIRGQLTVSLVNYDNNRYIQAFSIADKDSLNVRFAGITMAGKDPEKATFQLILGKDLSIDCPYKEFYSQYAVVLGAADCDSSEFRPAAPNYYPRQGHALTQ
jgi:hypothetical protein